MAAVVHAVEAASQAFAVFYTPQNTGFSQFFKIKNVHKTH